MESALFENSETAKLVLQTFLNINNEMDLAIVAIGHQASPEEYKSFKKAVGYVMFEVFDKIIEPICKQHPSLRSSGMQS
jgi:hypothetical protein